MTTTNNLPSGYLPHGVQLLHVVSAEEYPPAGGAFVWNGEGLAKLQWCASDQAEAPHQPPPYDHFLMLGDVPLLQWQSEDCYPTCTQLLQAGDTPTEDLESFAAVINAIRNDTPIESCLEPISPVIHLLSAGLYFVAFVDYVPTNGEDRFFWRAYGELRACRPLGYHLPSTPGGQPKKTEVTTRPVFLAPTQSTAKFHLNRYEVARLTYQDSPGLAFHLGGRLSALLDGHHRATCAAMNGVRFRALTIAAAQSREYRDGRTGLGAPGVYVPLSEISPQSRDLLNQFRTSPITLRETKYVDVAECHAALQRVVWPPLPKQITSIMNTATYPTDYQCDLMERIQDRDSHISDEIIESTLQGNCDHSDDRWLLSNLLEGLFAAQDSRFVPTAISVVKNPAWGGIWQTAYQLLSSIRSEEVENQFVQFLIDDDGSRPEIRAIVDRYFEPHD